MSKCRLLLSAGIVVAMLISVNARADYVLSTDQIISVVVDGNDVEIAGIVPIINRDFSEPNDGKHTAFDIEQSRKQDAPFFGDMTTDVPGWSSDISAKDSGIEDVGGDYGYTAFLLGGYSEWDDPDDWVEPSIWQILSYKIKEGDQFCLAVDVEHLWTQSPVVPLLSISLFYVDDGGGRTELANEVLDLSDISGWNTYILDVPDVNELAVGRLIGIEFQNIAERSSWIHIDNISLVPRPDAIEEEEVEVIQE